MPVIKGFKLTGGKFDPHTEAQLRAITAGTLGSIGKLTETKKTVPASVHEDTGSGGEISEETENE